MTATEQKDDCDQKLSIDCVKYFDGKFAELEKRLNLKDELANRALEKAEHSMASRLEAMNEFRNQLTQQAGSFATKKEVELSLEKVEIDMRMLRESKAALDAKASQLSVNITLTFALLGTVVSIISLVWK